jgi:hypothetical protein
MIERDSCKYGFKVVIMAGKKDDRTIPVSMRFSPIQHFQLRRIAEFDHRGLNDEIIHLVEAAARGLVLGIDWEEGELREHLKKATAASGMAEDEYIAQEKRDYAKRREVNEKKIFPKGSSMYRDDATEEEAIRDYYDLLEKVERMNPDITDWSKYTNTRDSTGMVHMRDRLINAIKRGDINGPKEDIPVSLKDIEDLFEVKARDVIREEIEDFMDETDQESPKKRVQ